jgi:hypothetical protein
LTQFGIHTPHGFPEFHVAFGSLDLQSSPLVRGHHGDAGMDGTQDFTLVVAADAIAEAQQARLKLRPESPARCRRQGQLGGPERGDVPAANRAGDAPAFGQTDL